MAKYPTRFEDLANELIFDICSYLNAREVFQSFSNLNFRFKMLLQSFNHLQLTVSLFDSPEKRNYEYFYTFIRTLIIDRGFNVNLKHFQNLHYLILRNPKEKLFEQLDYHSIRHIQYLSITHRFLTATLQPLINILHARIFSNHFPNLNSCNLSEMAVSMPIDNWQQSPSLNILKVGQINTFVYKCILSSCPNLYFFQLKKLQCNELPPNLILHLNLKQLVIIDEDQSFPWNDGFMNEYLLCVPNLEKLTIHRSDIFKKFTEHSNYGWLESIIVPSLRLLRRFKFVLHVYASQRFTKCYTENVFDALKEQFLRLHKDRYQVRIKFVQE